VTDVFCDARVDLAASILSSFGRARASMARVAFAPLLATVLMAGCREIPLVRQGPPAQRVVARTWSAPLPALRSSVLDVFTTKRSTLASPFDRMAIYELRPPAYPSDWLATWVDPAGALADYKRLAPELRRDDLLVEEPTGDAYWPSEYATRDGPVRFRCALIVHLAGVPAGTTVEIYEKVPAVWVGEHWALAAHGIGFGRYHDIRFVEPTMEERLRLLDLIDRIVASR
jgi:hypothetical protein